MDYDDIPVLSTRALEGNIFPITAAFRDSVGGDLVTPLADTVTWKLVDLAGNIIRDDTAIDSASSIVIVLDENDTVVGDYGIERMVIVTGRYNSATYGNNRQIKAAVRFYIQPVPGGA